MSLKFLILLGWVCLGATDNFPCERRKTALVVGKYKGVKLEKNSRFVFLSKKPAPDFTFNDAVDECKAVGLELAEIRHPSDLGVMETFFAKRGDAFAKNTTRFWHSAISPENGKWEYGNPAHEKLQFNAFWGLTSFHVPTKPESGPPSNYGMLQWVSAEGQRDPSLVMIDAEMNNAFTDKSFICEYPQSSECYSRSIEVKLYRQLISVSETIDQLSGSPDKPFYLSKTQMSNSEARTFCEANGMTLLELYTTTKEGNILTDALNEKMHIEQAKSVGFWVGENDVFNTLADFSWAWLDDKYVGSRVVPYFSPDLPVGRPGWHRYIGKCLAASIPSQNQTQWYLQPVSCDLPQWTICQDHADPTIAPTTLPEPEVLVDENALPDTVQESRGRGVASYPEQNFTMNCPKYADGRWRVYPKENCFRSFRCYCESKAWAVELFTCWKEGTYTDPTKVPSSCVTGKNPFIGKSECDWPERLPGRVELPCTPHFDCQTPGNFKHPDCKKYYQCRSVAKDNAVAAYLMTCASGKFFDPAEGKCVPGSCGKKAIESPAETKVTAPPPNITCTAEGIFPHPRACNMFYQCTKFRDSFRIYFRTCRAGSNFVSKKKLCVKGPCDNTGDFNCTKEGVFSNPMACDMFIQCMKMGNGLKKYTKNCKPGSNFDPVQGSCVEGACSQSMNETTEQPEVVTMTTRKVVTITETTVITTPSTESTSTTTETPVVVVKTTSTTREPITTEWTTTTIKPAGPPTTTPASNNVATTTERSTLDTSPKGFTSVTQMCTSVEVTTMEVTTPTTPTTPIPTTEIPYHAIECKRRGSVDNQYGDVSVKRVGRASKFAHLEYKNRVNMSYSETKEECEKWGLDLAEVKSQVDLKMIEEFLKTHSDGKANTDLSYWISGVDELRDGNWKYTTNAREGITFQSFWGMAPLYLTTNTENPEPANLMLRWQTDEETKKLFMIDVSPSDNFYQRQGILCQFPVSNKECYQKSAEEIELSALKNKEEHPDEIGYLKGLNHYIFSNKLQKTRKEAVEFCESNIMELIDIKSLDAVDTADLFSAYYEYAGKSAAFWIGHNDLFQANSALAWDWVNNRMAKPWEDAVLKQGDRIPEGRPRAVGKCLVLGTIDDKEPQFYLQHSPCELPQHVICMEPHVNLG